MPAPKPKGLWLLRTLVVAGALLAGLGGWLLTTDFAERDAARVAELPQVLPEKFQGLVPGQSVLLEGMLASSEPVGPQGFIVYRREQFNGFEESGVNQGQRKWLGLGTVTPAIAIGAGAASVAVSNRDYRLNTEPHVWMSDVTPRYVSVFDATERLLGFKAGDRVTVDGRVVAGLGDRRAPQRIEATVLFGGGAAAYVESVRGGVLVVKIVGAVFLGLGALLMGVCGWWLRSFRQKTNRRRDGK
ncbi:MAG: hypothetical protein Q8N18_00150 [Opitutaceae bacterium]|nr:hypothetical protein [Opitutaceae bacterium]